jgi:hypothetical protein
MCMHSQLPLVDTVHSGRDSVRAMSIDDRILRAVFKRILVALLAVADCRSPAAGEKQVLPGLCVVRLL